MAQERWLRIRVECSPATWDAVAVTMERVGCQGVELRDDPAVIGYLPETLADKIEDLKSHLQRFPEFDLPPVPPPQLDSVQAEEWQKAWRRFFRSRRIGQRLRVQPTWSRKKPHPDEITLYLDPGLAFGTGAHPTTALCLELLEKYLKPGDRVADLGTGTGILAIAAAKLGAREVWAVDSDPLAVIVAQENATSNCVADKIRILEGDGWHALEGKFDLVLCNILSSFLIQTASQVPNHLQPDGFYIVSGVIRQNWWEVKAAFASVGLQPVEIKQRQQWVAAVYRRAI